MPQQGTKASFYLQSCFFIKELASDTNLFEVRATNKHKHKSLDTFHIILQWFYHTWQKSHPARRKSPISVLRFALFVQPFCLQDYGACLILNVTEQLMCLIHILLVVQFDPQAARIRPICRILGLPPHSPPLLSRHPGHRPSLCECASGPPG